MELKNKKIMIVGAGKSGLASARFLKQRGAVVTLNDVKPLKELPEVETALRTLGVAYHFGGHPADLMLDQDIIVVSPGVPVDVEPFISAQKKGIELIGELELACRFISTPIIAITGTNGKTTTTTLLGELLKNGGVKVFVGGNIGTPLIEYAETDDMDIAVVEVSSFQLDTIAHFHPFGAINLNITPDHLDRYPGMKEYAESKMRIFENQETFDFAIVNADDEWSMKYRHGILSNIYMFSTKKSVAKGAWYGGGKIHLLHPSLKDEVVIADSEIRLKGLHNMENVMSAALAALEAGVKLESIRDTLRVFKGLHHRVELVETINGINFYNDSKGTNVGAVEKALEGFDKPVVLILGGKDKGAGYDYLNAQVKRIVKKVVALGEAKDKIYADLKDTVPVVRVGSLEEAVTVSYENAAAGDIVLLSPACSSFDMFKSYTERGEKFVGFVKKLKEKAHGKN